MFDIYLYNDDMKNVDENDLPDICYIVAKGGIYLRKNLELSISMTKVDKISFLNEIHSHAKLKIEKIPFETFLNIRELFAKSYKEFRAESVVFLYYSSELKKYHVYCPKQEVGGATANYSELPPGYSINKGKGNYLQTVSVHSHLMSAFHSGGDIMDEEGTDGLHITIGHIGSDEISLSVSVVINGNRFLVDPSEYIEDINNYRIEPKKEEENKSIIPSTYYASYLFKKDNIVKYALPRDKHNVKIIDEWFKNVDGTSIAYNWKKKQEERMKAFRSDVETFESPYRGAGIFSNIIIRNKENEKDNDCPCNNCVHKNKKISMMAEELQEFLESIEWEDDLDEEDLLEVSGNLIGHDDDIYADIDDSDILYFNEIQQAGYKNHIFDENDPENYNFAEPKKINDKLKGGLE